MRQSNSDLRLWAGLWGGLAVILGAFGAHGLEQQLLDRGMTAVWDTAVFYHFVHAAVVFTWWVGRLRGVSGGLWLAGSAIFCLSLYALALGGPGWLGPITPLGGLLMVGGWFALPWARRDEIESSKR